MTAAFTFPGQGSQAVGMGKALADAFPAARAVFDEVDSALGEKLTGIIWDGPAETLQLTQNAQPALMAVSLAAMRVLETEAGFVVGRDAAFVAGHSLGEYSALARCRQPDDRRYRTGAADPRACDAESGPGRGSARWPRCSALITRRRLMTSCSRRSISAFTAGSLVMVHSARKFADTTIR